MNRRNFIRGLVTAVAGFTILPPATTYSRIWRVQKTLDLERFQRRLYEILRDRGPQSQIDVFTDRITALSLSRATIQPISIVEFESQLIQEASMERLIGKKLDAIKAAIADYDYDLVRV